MPAPTTFGVGTKPVFVQVDDLETLTLYPRGGSMFYGDKSVTTSTGTEVTSGSSVTLSNDVWVVAGSSIRVNAVATSVITGEGVDTSYVDEQVATVSEATKVQFVTEVPATLEEGREVWVVDGERVLSAWVGDADGLPQQTIDGSQLLYVCPDGVLPPVEDTTDPSVAVDTSVSPPIQYVFTDGAWTEIGVNTTGATSRHRWFFPGDQVVDATPTVPGTSPAMDDILVVQAAGTIGSVSAQALTSPSGQALIYDMLKSTDQGGAWDSIFPTNPGNRPTIPAGEYASGQAIPDTTAVVKGDWLQPVAKQIGSATPTIPTFVDSTFPAIAASTSPQIDRHSLAQTGDVQLAVIYQNPGTTTVSPDVDGPGNAWALLNPGGTPLSTGGQRLWWFWRLDDGEAGPWTFTVDVAPTTAGHFSLLVRGADPADPIDSTAFATDTTFNTSATLPDLTTVADDCLEIVLDRVTTSVTATGATAAGYTVDNGFDGGGATNLHIAWKERPTAGASTGATITWSASCTGSMGRVAIKGDPAGGAAVVGADATVDISIS